MFYGNKIKQLRDYIYRTINNELRIDHDRIPFYEERLKDAFISLRSEVRELQKENAKLKAIVNELVDDYYKE